MVNTDPVRMAGKATGRTWCRIVSQRVAPTAKDASRRPPGTARSASEVVMIMIGSTRTANVSPPAITFRPPMPRLGAEDAAHEDLDEEKQTEDPVDDRRHPGQVADVGADEPGHTVVGGVLLQVDGRRHAQPGTRSPPRSR